MFGLPLAFTLPAVTVALAGLPLLYFLLRATPPRPRQIPFPPLRLILGLRPQEETPNHTPWWLLALRMAIAALLILAMAGPIWNPLPGLAASPGSLLIVIDDGWPAAPNWDARMSAAMQHIDAWREEGRPVALASISEGSREIEAMEAARALDHLRAIKPVPYRPDHLSVLRSVEQFVSKEKPAAIVWISDGLEEGNARTFAEKLAGLGPQLIVLRESKAVHGLANPRNAPGALEIDVLRSRGEGLNDGFVRARDAKGMTIAEAGFHWDQGPRTQARFDLPIELRNDIARLEIEREASAGAVSLLDESVRRRRVGVISGETADVSQPLLAPNYYLTRALAPFADVREVRPGTPDPIGTLLNEQVNVLVLADIGSMSSAAHEQLVQFVEQGGILVRFAGVRLSGAQDDLVPVRLRSGGRVLGGSLSWDIPKHLAPFDQQSPFFGLAIPEEVTISRQVLAEPDAGLTAKTWAHLSDGTPLVTAEKRGKGMIILFHVTADTTWSNLPLSGLFVDMLRKIVGLSAGMEPRQGTALADGDENASVHPLAGANHGQTLAPWRTLDGFGVLGAPSPLAKPLPVPFTGSPDAEHPPGFYGPPEALFAVNALASGDSLTAVDLEGISLREQILQAARPVDLRAFLIFIVFLLFLVDAAASLWLAGGWARFSRRLAVAFLSILCAGVILPSAGPAHAAAKAERQTVQAAALPPNGASRDDLRGINQRDQESALTTRLAYVRSNDPKVDAASHAGLISLSRALASRTSMVPGEPIGVDPAKDELAFYPLLYWPVAANAPQPPPEVAGKLSAFMKQGGTILFDTRDAFTARPGGPPTPEALWLRHLLEGVDVPQLEPVPADHVVTKTFYLLDSFVGRYENGTTWIEALPPQTNQGDARPVRSGDGVSPIIITGNDLAAGWAADAYGDSLYALIPGDRRQHEMALRGGINLVMYTLTGNYKADQVHVRDLLERLAH
ncbi:DUF4159 domain-containing protein [Beijerinckia mobilis]|uniref:DUF4159 domain-containing protein n=1 Tax=Beijerinckia mobilis TaxID=231434 RepID=UPI00054E0509|nr:DUF4159 domain-containing protein [Beijerinckia mobilis]